MESRTSKNNTPRAEVDSFVTRDGRFGEIRGRFWSTRDELTGELTFHAELPNVSRHFQADFDVCILVVAWNLWSLAGRENVWFQNGHGLSDDEKALAFLKTTQFITNGIEAWIHEQGKLAFAEGITNADGSFWDGHNE